jgi:lipid-A-disaccharide synthase
MGFIEVVFNLKTILEILKYAKDILTFQPDVIIFSLIILFNMRIAKWAREIGLKTHYYIHLKFGLGKKTESKKSNVMWTKCT